ncbi:MAG TPA: hypothetical protein VF181_06435 [Balneolaceae bacterium]
MGNYSKRDIKAILSRAAELQERSRERQAGKEEASLSLEEIEEIARQAGVSTDFVREAVLEYEGIPVKEPLFLDTGSNSEIEVVGFAKGELDKRTWAELRSIIEYEFNLPGKVRRRPDGIIWEAQPQGVTKILDTQKSTRVEISSGKGQTTIHVKKGLKTYDKAFLTPALLLWLLAAFMVAIMFVEGEPAPLFFAIISAFAGEFFRRWNKRKKDKVRQQLKDTMEQLQTIITRRFRPVPVKDDDKQSAKLLDQHDENNYINEQTIPSKKKERS